MDTPPPFHLAPDPDFAARLTREIQSTRDLLEARMSALASPLTTDPKEVLNLKKTLNSLCCRTLQKGALIKRLKSKLKEEHRERSAALGEQAVAEEWVDQLHSIAAQIEAVNKRRLEEESHSLAYASLKSKEAASLVRSNQLISKERVLEIESVRKQLMRKYELVQQTQFKAASHLTLTHDELRRELKSASSIRKRQEHYSDLAESLRTQRQESVEKDIEAMSRAKLTWQDRQTQARTQLLRLQAEVRELETTRQELRARKAAVAGFQQQFALLQALVPGSVVGQEAFAARVVAKYKELAVQQTSLSGRFHELSAEHDVKKKQCEEIRAELDRLRLCASHGEVKWKGSVNMMRAAVEDNQSYKKLKKASHDSEQLVLSLYLKLSHFMATALRKVQATADSSVASAVKAVLLQMSDGNALETHTDAKETASRKRRGSVRTFQTEIDVGPKPSLAYALSEEDIRRTLLLCHPSLAGESQGIAALLHSIPSIAHFLSIRKLEEQLRNVAASEVVSSCGNLVVASYSALAQKLAIVTDSLPILSSIKSTVDSTDMSAFVPLSKGKPHPTPRVRKITVDNSEEVQLFPLPPTNQTDSDETVPPTQAYLELARREAKETLLKSRTLDIPRSASLPKVTPQSSIPRKQGVVLRLAQMEEKLRILRESEKSAIEHLRRQRGLSATQRGGEGQGSYFSYRSMSSSGSVDTRPGTSAFRMRPSITSSRRSSQESQRPRTVNTYAPV